VGSEGRGLPLARTRRDIPSTGRGAARESGCRDAHAEKVTLADSGLVVQALGLGAIVGPSWI
jgi:hypothetical protein